MLDFKIFLFLSDHCRMKTAWNQWSQINIYAIMYIWRLIYIYLLLYYTIALSQILSTHQIILHLVCHKPTKWDSDNHTLLIYIYIYIYIYILLKVIYIYILLKVMEICTHILNNVEWWLKVYVIRFLYKRQQKLFKLPLSSCIILLVYKKMINENT